MYSITDVEQAINYWRARQASTDDFSICPRGRVLADVYGSMIFYRQEAVEPRTLTAEQNEALSLALAQRELPL
ncbi:DUF3717 domain-containing protein [Caballeronia cordobensis]|uniref:DUF3717 domain-containing protein n=1 Tax=Caballeronia cordobensis TaxID=1353886 RepID=UPI0005EF7D16